MSRATTDQGAFFFVAVRPDGARRLGLRRAESRRALTDALRRERLVPVRSWALPAWAAPESRLKLKDQTELNTQLAALLTRGVPLVEALEVTSQTVSPAARRRVDRQRELVASGTSFADACRKAGGYDDVSIAVYRAAERSGDLGGAARQLATMGKRRMAVSGKAATLMIYPAVVTGVGVLVTLLLLMLVVPQIGTALSGQGLELPAVTRVLVTVGTGLKENVPLALGALGALVVVLVALRGPIFSAVWGVARRLPRMRELVSAQEQARFFAVMAAMTRSGVPLADALGTGAGAVTDVTMRRQIVSLRTRLVEGGALRSLIDSVTAFPATTRRLLVAAERAGDVQSAFDALATDLAEEVDRRASRLLAVLEPLLIVLMFLVIGALMLAIMVPLIRLTSQAI